MADPKDVAGVIDRALPALIRDWCEVHSNVQGGACYRLTEAGLAIHAHSAAGEKRGPSDPDCCDVYNDALAETLERMRTEAPPDPSDIGPCPLPVSRPLNAKEPWASGLAKGAS